MMIYLLGLPSLSGCSCPSVFSILKISVPERKHTGISILLSLHSSVLFNMIDSILINYLDNKLHMFFIALYKNQ